MKPQLTFFLVAAAALALPGSGCVADHSWPRHASDPFPWPEPKAAVKVLEDRFDAASTSALGTPSDIAAVQKAVAARARPEVADVRELRWLSPTLVMAYTRTPHAAFYYVAEKRSGNWYILKHYMLWLL